jgi:uncharacterized protein
MIAQNIKKIIISYNPWWEGNFTLKYKEREIYTKEIKKFINTPQIISLTGIRRVGKTTIIYKIIEDYISRKIDPKSIFYFSFDNEKDIDLMELISEYELITKKSIKKNKLVFCFDEIQKVNDWENKIKTIYDMQKLKENIKIYISGSESLFIKKKSKESLAGRIFDFKINQLSFKEYLNFKEIDYSNQILQESNLIKSFDDYIITQGFPELITKNNNIEIMKAYTENILEKVMYSDIIKQYNIREVPTLESIIKIISKEPGQIIDLVSLSSDLKVSRQTISIYIQYLLDSFLIKKIYNYSKNTRKSEKKLKKYYPTIIDKDLIFNKELLFKSKVFETIIINQTQVNFFWRDDYKNEVDGIFVGKETIPLEIKFGKIEIKGVVRFLLSYKLKKGYILSYNEERTIKEKDKYTIDIIPAWKFLLNKEKYLK